MCLVSQRISEQFVTSSRLWLHVLCTLNKTTIEVHINKPTRGSHRTSKKDRKTIVPIVVQNGETWKFGILLLGLNLRLVLHVMDKQIQKAVEAAIMKVALVSNNHISLLIADLEKNLKTSEIEQLPTPLVDRVKALESNLSIYEEHLTVMEYRLENAEQYSRRSCLRIFGVPLPENGDETSKNCLAKGKRVFKYLGVAVPDDCIDRVHRIGRVKANIERVKSHSGIQFTFVDITVVWA